MENITPPDKFAKISELERELKARKSFYPRLISKSKISKDRANRQYFVLQSILADYKGKGALGQPIHWICPVCDAENVDEGLSTIVKCKPVKFSGCGNGPLLLADLDGQLKAHKINGFDYAVQSLLL